MKSTLRLMRGRLADGVRLSLWLLFLGAAIASLHGLAKAFPLTSLAEAGGVFETSLAAALRALGLAVGYWLAGSTVLCVLAAIPRTPASLRRVAQRTAIAPVRQLADRLAAGALVASLTLPAAAAATVSPGYVPVPAGDEAPSPRPPVPAPTAPPSVSPADLPPQPSAPERDAEPPATISSESVRVVVKPGDHMWKLAEDRLTAIMGRPVADSEIAPYWLRVIGANLRTIRSGDPDLIFPGETLVLPPVDDAPAGEPPPSGA